jgi:hypothetical protein
VLSAFDVVLYSGEYSVFRTFAGSAVDGDSFRIHQYMDDNALVLEVAERGIIHDQNQTKFPIPVGVTSGGRFYQHGAYCDNDPATDPPECDDKTLLPDPANPANIQIAPLTKKIDYERAAALVGAGSGTILMEQVFASMIVASLIAYIMVTMLRYVPLLAEDLAGGVREAPGVAQVSARDLPGIGERPTSSGNLAKTVRDRAAGMVGE